MRSLDADGLHVGLGGDGTTRVVLVHGAMDRGAAFLRATRHLSDLSYVVYDRRGYGRSTVEGEPPTFDDHVGDLLTVISASDDPSTERTVLVGHSLGATIALAACARVATIADALVVYEPPLPWLEWWPITDPEGRRIEDDDPHVAVERFMGRVIGIDAWEALPARTRDERMAEGPTLISELVTARIEPFVRSEISVPTIVSRGSACDPVRVRAADWLVEGIPDARLVCIDDAPHGAHMTHPAAFVGLVEMGVEVAASHHRP